MSNYSKTDLRYWEQAVRFPKPTSKTYAVHLQHKGKRQWIGLHTANKEQAAILARKFYQNILPLGWEETLRRHKLGTIGEKSVNVTVGEYLDAVRAKSLIHAKTLESYAGALRKIASDIRGITHNGKRSTWRERVDAIKLGTLTSQAIETWRTNFIKRGSINPLAEKSARISANSFIGRARSLFGAEVISRVRDLIELPNPVPFAGVKVQRVHVTSYRSGFNVETLLKSAREELATAKPEQFKMFLLGAMAGLRRNEIDKLPWTAFRWDEGVIHIQTTEYFRPKSRESENDIPVDPELMEIFRGYHSRAKDEFVIESDSVPDVNAPFEHYRCQAEFTELIGWLRAHGVTSRTPLHVLRKEFGSQINARYGLTAAQEMLRHANVAVTAAHYVENKQRSVLGFGHLLKNDRTIVPIDSSLTPATLSAQQKA
jgi:Phage integrase family